MKVIAKHISIIVSFSFLLSIISCGGSSSNKDDKQSFLFVQNSQKGSITQISDDYFHLKLIDVAPMTQYFSNRNENEQPSAGTIPMDTFIASWDDPSIKDNFKSDPPNAALEVYDESGKLYSLALQLEAPIYTSNKNNLEYRVKVIEQFPDSYVGQMSLMSIPPTFLNASIFIDNASTVATSLNFDREDCTSTLTENIPYGDQFFLFSDAVSEAVSYSNSCKVALPTQDSRDAMAKYLQSSFRAPYSCGNHSVCGKINVGNNFSDCLSSCQGSGCDVTYNGAPCWCSYWCFGRFAPYP